MAHRTRIMYIESKGGEWVERWGIRMPSGEACLTGSAHIGRMIFSKTGRSLYYGGYTFHKAEGFKSNYLCEQTGESYWISGPKKRGGDALYATNIRTPIDEDVRVEYWTSIRGRPDRVHETETS